MSRSNRAFTLLEVMAAVALLGILYTVLARVAIEALRAEGESRRRLEAALIADTKLGDSFTATEGSVVIPPLGHSEITQGDFKVALDVALFQPPVEWGLSDESLGTPQLFASSPGVPGAQALRTVQLTVSWLEGAEERHVSRTIFLVDFESVSGLAAGAEQAPRAPEEGAAPPQLPESALPPSELEAP
ncbi:MAG TPA: type II secretion system protein [Myxococcota bacterium]|jgi:prepilin-type N-terminal cleavage/methylation domain-containing protein